jgi:predicted DNA-binding transcriptional regulator AlpA
MFSSRYGSISSLTSKLKIATESAMSPEILNEQQVHEVYGFSVPYLRRARRERRGPRFLKVGKLVRYRRTDIEAYLSAHVVETEAKRA